MKEEFLLALLEEHISEITLWVNEKLALPKAEVVDEVLCGDPISWLPGQLRRMLQNKRAFRRAFRSGLITYEQGVWYSHFNNASQFSYFCARCFSDDRLVRGVLKKGGFCFPASSLQKTFRVGNVKDSRKKLLETKISDRYQYIDNLFDECCNKGK